MEVKAFVKIASEELNLGNYSVVISKIPQLPDGMANIAVNPLLKVIAVTPEAATLLSEDELCAVMTHELGHSYHHHAEKRIVIDGVSVVLSGINVFLPLPIWKKVLIQIGLTATEIALKWKLFHTQEFEADEMSYRFHLNKQLASALRKLEDANSKFKPTNPVLAAISSITHPDTEERIKRLTAPVVNGN
jgi:Zn-dependent protease with chaperone function